MLLPVLAAIHGVCYYPFLPPRVASHFGPGGQPDAWSSKEAFVAGYAIVFGATALFLLLVGLVLPRMPASWINLPNKEYWLAPSRRAAAVAALVGYYFWFADATLGLLFACVDVAFRFNLGRIGRPGVAFWTLVGAYILFTTGWSVALLRRFRGPGRTR